MRIAPDIPLQYFCPICNSKAKYEIYNSEWGTEEEYMDCKKCGHFFQFAYGNYVEIVGNKYFIWDYKENRRQFFKRIKRAEFMARRRWKKYHKGTTVKNCPI